MTEAREYILSKQLLRAGTSIGAKVAEAGAAQSHNDFIAKMAIASKDARDAKYWLRLLQESVLVEVVITSALTIVDELIRLLTAHLKTSCQNR